MQGSYNNYECGLAISDAEAGDDGDWSCEFESYVRNGKRGDGTLASVSGGLAPSCVTVKQGAFLLSQPLMTLIPVTMMTGILFSNNSPIMPS